MITTIASEFLAALPDGGRLAGLDVAVAGIGALAMSLMLAQAFSKVFAGR